MADVSLKEHEQTYRGFKRGLVIGAATALFLLAIVGLIFA